MFEWDSSGLVVFVLFILGFPPAVIIGWALVRGFQRGVQFWRTLLAGLFMASATVGAIIGWSFLFYGSEAFYDILGRAFGRVFLVGIFVILIGGTLISVWALQRVGDAGLTKAKPRKQTEPNVSVGGLNMRDRRRSGDIG